MSYMQKLELIEDEIENMADDDLPEALVEETSQRLQEEEFEAALARFHDDWESSIEASELYSESRDALREQLLEERLTPEEKKEGERIKLAEAVTQAEAAVSRAQKDLELTKAKIAEATQRNKPKMLVHETQLLQLRESTLKYTQGKLAEAREKAEAAGVLMPPTFTLYVSNNDFPDLPLGASAKLTFESAGHGENMWVRITGKMGPRYEGTLANNPIFIPLKYGDIVVFGPEHIHNYELAEETVNAKA